MFVLFFIIGSYYYLLDKQASTEFMFINVTSNILDGNQTRQIIVFFLLKNYSKHSLFLRSIVVIIDNEISSSVVFIILQWSVINSEKWPGARARKKNKQTFEMMANDLMTVKINHSKWVGDIKN